MTSTPPGLIRVLLQIWGLINTVWNNLIAFYQVMSIVDSKKMRVLADCRYIQLLANKHPGFIVIA
jgi:hypothetical protein